MKLLLFFCLLSSAAALSVAEIKIIGLPTCQENPLNDFLQQLTDAVKEILNFVELEIKLIDCYLAEVNVGLGGNTTTTAPSTQAFTSPASNPDTTPGTETSPQNPTDSNNPTDIPSTNGPSLPVPTLPPLK